MPLQNRVDPFGVIHAVPDRGLFMGNRDGCFHTKERTLRPTQWGSRQWITCDLEYKNQSLPLMEPGHNTQLFFLDEATALASGHRPCFHCRRKVANEFRAALLEAGAFQHKPSARDMSEQIASEIISYLKSERSRERIRPLDLPDGAMFTTGSSTYLLWKGLAWPWSFAGYGEPITPPEDALRLTPYLTCEALRHGYTPRLHSSVPDA